MALTLLRDASTLSPFEAFAATLPTAVPRDRAVDALLATMTAAERNAARYKWQTLWARPSQRLPTGEWDLWYIRAGRGAGKTRAGAEGVRKLVNDGAAHYITLIGPTASDARDVMIEGPESGLLAVHPPDVRPEYRPSTRTLRWPNGAEGHVRSAEEPDSVRGLNTDLIWGDEPASWKTGSAVWDTALLGNRVGRPHAIITGTPRPLQWLRALEAEPGTRLTTGSTYENRGNLAPAFVKLILARYEGTRLGRQELHAEYLEDVEGALWTMAMIETSRITSFTPADPWGSLRLAVARAGQLGAVAADRRRWRTVVGVDPPGETAECGIIVASAPERARSDADHGVILDDMSLAGPPEMWGAQVAAAVRKWDADLAVVESNQGGDMCRAVIHAADPNVKVEKIRATESKYDRAEPVSTLYGRGRWHHAGYFGPLESQMTTWVPAEDKSPDRIDALVHAATYLMPPIPIPQASFASTARRGGGPVSALSRRRP